MKFNGNEAAEDKDNGIELSKRTTAVSPLKLHSPWKESQTTV